MRKPRYSPSKQQSDIRRFGRLIEDGVGDMPYAESFVPTPGIARLFAGGGSVPAWQQWLGFQWSGGSIRDFTPQAIAAVRDAVDHAPPCGWAFEIGHHMHGAVCDATLSQSPLPRVRNSFTFHFDAYWDKPDQEASALAWVGASAAALRPHALPTYVNYLSTDAPSAIAEAYGNAFPRLRQVKKHYDPGNVFRRNRNIPPA